MLSYKRLLWVWLFGALVGCTGQNGTTPAVELQDESAVSNGGNLLTASLHKFFTADVPELLQRPENLGLLSDKERAALIHFLTKKGIPIVPVTPMDVITKDSLDRFGKPTLIRDGQLVDERGELRTERIVYEKERKRWALEIDEPAWDQMTSFGKEFPVNKSRPLLKLAFQFAYIKKVLERTGESPDDLVLPVSEEIGVEDENFKRKEVVPVEGATFIGDIYCPSIRFDYDALPKPVSERKVHRCSAKIEFKGEGKAQVTVTDKAGAVYVEYKDVGYTQEHVTITLKTGALTRKVSLVGWGNDDVLNLTSEDQLYRMNEAMPLLAGKTFEAEMFCEVAKNGGLLKPAPWRPRAVYPIKDKAICRVHLELKVKEEGSRHNYFSLDISRKETNEVIYIGTGWFEQIGVNVILHHSNKSEEDGYLWLCRECQKHLAMGAGEFLFDRDGFDKEELPEPMWGEFTVDDVRLGDVFPDTHARIDTRVSLVFKFERYDEESDGYAGRVRLIKTEKVPNGVSTPYIGQFREAGLTVVVDFFSFAAPMVLKNAGDKIVTAHYTAVSVDCEEDCDE